MIKNNTLKKIKSFNKKPHENENDKQLFSFDVSTKGAKNFFFDTYENVYNNIKSQEVSNYYEDNTFTDKIKLFIDIDEDVKFETRLDRNKYANNLALDIIFEINIHLYQLFKINNPKAIILISNALSKLSLHVIYHEIIFKNISEMKYFMMDIKKIDHSVYKRGAFRTLYSSKLNKDNKLVFFRGINYEIPNDDFNLFKNTSICNIDNETIINLNLPEIIKKQYTKKQNLINRNYTYKNINFDKIKLALDKINLQEYSEWLMVAFCMKDLYVSCDKKLQKNIYKLFDDYSKKSSTYNKTNNKNIFMNLEPKININYLFKMSNDNYYIYPFYNYNEIIFNKNNHENIIVKNETFIDIDINKLLIHKYIFIKSPTGTGKTTYLKKLIDKININNIISITSRVNLAGEHVKHLNLEFYQNLTNFENCNKLVIQLESLIKCYYELYKDGILILDEINSLLSHLRSPTLNNKRSYVYKYLLELVRNAKYVICLDADLADWNIKFLNEIKEESSIIYYNTIKNKLNNKVIIYNNQQIMINKMIKQIQNNEYFISCFDSLKKMNIIIDYLSKFGNKKEWLIYSSEIHYGLIDTSEWKNKFVFFTPTIIYGIDYNYEMVDVFCFVHKTHLNPLQIYQMISRARKQKNVNIYCKEKEYKNRYQSVEDVIEETNQFEKNFNYMVPEFNKYIDIEDNPYKIMYYNYKFMDSILKTNIRGYLIDMLENKGYEIEYNEEIDDDLLDKKVVNKIDIRQRIVDLLMLNGKCLTEFENELVSNDKSLEKHFNLRIFLNDNIKDKLGESIEKNLFIESLKNKYSKIGICNELMKVLEINGFEGLTKDVIGRFDYVVNNEWIKDNIKNIKDIFDIRAKKKYDYTSYYNLYLLLITILKNMFDIKLFNCLKIRNKNKNRYYYYFINENRLNCHKNIINIINLSNFLD